MTSSLTPPSPPTHSPSPHLPLTPHSLTSHSLPIPSPLTHSPPLASHHLPHPPLTSVFHSLVVVQVILKLMGIAREYWEEFVSPSEQYGLIRSPDAISLRSPTINSPATPECIPSTYASLSLQCALVLNVCIMCTYLLTNPHQVKSKFGLKLFCPSSCVFYFCRYT